MTKETPSGSDAGPGDVARYRANLRSEQEAAALYAMLAGSEHDSHLAEIYGRMEAVERRHAALWADRLRQAGSEPGPERLGWRVHALGWLARRFGAGAVLPVVSSNRRLPSCRSRPHADPASEPRLQSYLGGVGRVHAL